MKYLFILLSFVICLSGAVPGLSSPSPEERSPSQNQLFNFAINQSYYGTAQATNLHGTPITSLTASDTVGNRGEILLQDFVFMEKLAAFTRERIPERIVHAKGTGAHGYFQVTHDVSQYTKANFLNGIGKKTPVFVRLSTAIGGLGSADTTVDQHGFATKFYTDEGIHDILALSIEPFSIFDPIMFPDINRSRKKNPVTGRTNDYDSWWDFVSLRPETMHHILHLFSDRGRPESYRRMNSFAVNVFKFVNATGGVVYGKFHWRSNTPWKALTFQEAELLAGRNPEYKSEDLFDAIGRGEYPSWDLLIQVQTQEEIDRFPGNPFDLTRVWRLEDVPLIPVGKMTLNRNPVNQFAETEQVAFAPSNMVPGVAPSQDRLLTGRLFVYQDAQRYRLGGPNFPRLPINSPRVPVHTYQRDGAHCYGDNQDGAPNYYPNSFGGPEPNPNLVRLPPFVVSGVVRKYDVQEDDPFEQPRIFLERDVGPDERKRLVESMADWLKGARREIRERVLKNNVYPIQKKFGDELRAAVKKALANDWRDTACRQWERPGADDESDVDDDHNAISSLGGAGGWGRRRSGGVENLEFDFANLITK